MALFLLLAGSLMAQIPAKDAADGWIELFDGQTNFGWTPEGNAQWSVTGKTKRAPFLRWETLGPNRDGREKGASMLRVYQR